jgi:hypothetical protein
MERDAPAALLFCARSSHLSTEIHEEAGTAGSFNAFSSAGSISPVAGSPWAS